ncbi:DUF5979 domain-containing protein [Streptacidiphilus sp. MAP12-20]|uniref:DUF5979 domain-containing protein n=1 Tax=Streptacidiphilus sp. MAP12-20 TaxID=3156299 RepID=UPI0035133E35
MLASAVLLPVPASAAGSPPSPQHKAQRAASGAELTVKKEAVDVPSPLTPGGVFSYRLTVSCSSLTTACENVVLDDDLPRGLEVTATPNSTPTRTVVFDATSKHLAVTFKESIGGGKTGLPGGVSRTFDVAVRVPVDTSYPDGQIVTNTAKATADNAPPASDSADVKVSVPRSVKPVGTKSWAPASGVAGSGTQTTITLGVRNGSAGAQAVDSLRIDDATLDTWRTFDLTGQPQVTGFPAGADRAQLLVCTKPVATPCNPGEQQAGPVTAGPGLALPAGVTPGQVTAVRVVFTNAAGTKLPPSATAGQVALPMKLRDTLRSDGSPLRPTVRQRIDNCAAPSAEDAAGITNGATACAPFDILPNQATIDLSKQYFSDVTGSYKANGTALLGQKAPVSAVVTGKNTSPFPVQTLTISEPSTTAASRFSALDVKTVRPTFPSGATAAKLEITCRDGSTLPSVPLTPADSGKDRSVDCPAGGAPARVSITYTGAIAVNASADLGVHGALNGTETLADVATGLSDCADGAATNPADGSGSAAATACANLALRQATQSVSGSKSSSQNEIAKGQPVDFNLTMSNGGNTELSGLTMTDPVDPTAADNLFKQVRVVNFAVVGSQPKGITPNLEVYDPTTSAWVAYNASDTALLTRATGVRAVVSGAVPASARINLALTVQLRDNAAESGSFRNCARISAGVAIPYRDACAPVTTVGPQRAGASLGKTISPGTVARTLNGVPPQNAQVQLKAANTGNLDLKQLVVTDVDQGFFDSVDFKGIDKVNFPPGADRVRVDVCTTDCAGGVFVQGTVTASSTPGLPAGVSAADVRGIRFTFISSTGGYALLPGENFPATGACPGATACFSVTPRATLRSKPAQEIPASTPDTATGGYETRLQNPGQLAPIPDAQATLNVNDGSAQLRIDKSPDSKVGPGEPVPFTLTVQNSGTGVIPDLVVADPVPAGLRFDESFRGSGGLPFDITFEVPAGTPVPAASDAVFAPERAADGTVTKLLWRFPKWQMLPGSTVRITFQAHLAGGTVAGATIRNTAGASSQTRSDVSCDLHTPRNGQVVDDAQYGPGRFCTSYAQVTTVAGAAFDAFKWVSGTPSLGWWDSVAQQRVPLGDPRCPQLNVAGRDYTRYPCVALNLPGEPHHFVIKLTNTGTQPATQAQLLDVLPHPGDTGVLLGREQRGTEWDRSPTLSGAPTLLSGPGTLGVRYSRDASPCSDKVPTPNRRCDAVSWESGFDAKALGLEMQLDFPTPLAPGDGVVIDLPLTSPNDLADVNTSGLSLAWNSFAHRETVSGGAKGETTLPVTEPPKSGIGLLFGGLQAEKLVENPPPGGVAPGPFTFEYECTVGGATVRSGSAQVTADKPMRLSGIPAGATCLVWESDPAGAVSDHPDKAHAASVVIEPELEGKGAATVLIKNAYPPYPLIITKKVTGAAASLVGQGPFTVAVDCKLNEVSEPGFPRDLVFDGAGSKVISNLPIGARCTAVETDKGGATSSKVTTEHSSDPQVAVVNSLPGEIATLVVANDFPAGGLTVEQTISGPGAAKAKGPFQYEISCSFDTKRDVVKRQISLAKPKLTETLTGIPAGAGCEVRQTANGGSDRTTMPKGPFTVPPNGVVTVPVDNHFPAGSGGVIHKPPTATPDPVDNSNGGTGGDGSGTGDLAHTGGGTPWQPFALGGLLMIGVGLALRSAVRRRSS